MRILIDADGCPVVKLAVAIGKKHNVETLILCDTAHIFNIADAETITVDKGADAVDFKLVNMLVKGDIVVTQDYGLAAMSLAKQAIPISQNGLVYNDFNIDGLLHARHTSKKIRMAGGKTKGPAKRREEQNDKFAKTLESLLK